MHIRCDASRLRSRARCDIKEAVPESVLPKDPNRFWWLSPILVFASAAGFWYFEHRLFPASSGGTGTFVGFLLGAFLAALFEDYIDQNLK
jgi:hypothetical protein